MTVWRELRRVGGNVVCGAPAHVVAAWAAAQRVYGATDKETGECELVHAASFGDYIRAQGGVAMGRDYKIGVARKEVRIEGRYGVYDGEAPVGVYARCAPDAVYESTRYTWTRKVTGVDVRRSWSPVNNCTDPAWTAQAGQGETIADFDDAWFDSEEYQKIFVPPEVVGEEWHAAEVAAHEIRSNTVWTRLASDKTRRD